MTEFATQTTTEGAAHLILDGPMTIYNVADIKQQLLSGLHTATVLQLDLSHVSEIDTAGFQVLVMAKREAQRLQRELRIVAHSPAVQDVIEFFNMGAFFGDPLLIPAR